MFKIFYKKYWINIFPRDLVKKHQNVTEIENEYIKKTRSCTKTGNFVVFETLVLDNVFALSFRNMHFKITVVFAVAIRVHQWIFFPVSRGDVIKDDIITLSLPQAPEKKEERYAPVATNMKLIEA